MSRKVIALLFVITIVTGCKESNPKPKLVIFISVDQLSQQMFDHYQDLFSGGYKWLIDNGNWFTNLHHEHWDCSTGPGHFVLSSGQHPVKGGVLGNTFYDRDLKRKVYCVEDTLAKIVGKDQAGQSYRRIPTTTLGDWLKAEHPDSKIFSVSVKNRTAILLAGKNPDLAVWYDWKGSFVTSDYYVSENPVWLTQYNENNNLTTYRDSMWTRELTPDIYEKYARVDNFYGEIDRYDNQEYSPIFPIGFDPDLTNEQVFDRLGDGPWLDIETFRLAEIIMKKENLGQDGEPDILFIGLSGTDEIGHHWGPFSQEGMDNQLKIDKYLKRFITIVNKNVGLENVLFILTADHGVLPLPEYLTEYQNLPAGRINRETYNTACETALNKIEKTFGSDLIHRRFNEFYYNINKLTEYNIAKLEIDKILRENIAAVEGIGIIVTKDEILFGDPNDKIIASFQNFTDPHKSPDLVAIPKEYWTFKYPLGATHGVPYDYDSNVPLIIAHEGLRKNLIDKYYGAVDIAPTIAKILDINIPEFVDGKPIF
jgi:predicted AlkP superfamily pyrophosphatase or phosphodiesterase